MQEIGQKSARKRGWAYNTSWAYNTYSTVSLYIILVTIIKDGAIIIAWGDDIFRLKYLDPWGTLYFKGAQYISLSDPQYFARGTTYFDPNLKYYGPGDTFKGDQI